jgi:hypothetical protein
MGQPINMHFTGPVPGESWESWESWVSWLTILSETTEASSR